MITSVAMLLFMSLILFLIVKIEPKSEVATYVNEVHAVHLKHMYT